MIRKSLLAAPMMIGAVLFCHHSHAQTSKIDDQANQWVVRKTIMSYGPGFSDKRRGKKDVGETLFTSSTSQPGIYFSCLGGKFRAGLVAEAQPMSVPFLNMEIVGVSGGGNVVPTRESLAIVSARFNGGKKVLLGKWLHIDDKAAALSRDSESARKLYNAVVRGQTIDVKIKSGNSVRLTVPAISNTFADFGAGCGIGRNR